VHDDDYEFDLPECNICALYRPGRRGDERLIRLRNEERFELGLDLYRDDPAERQRLREERSRRIRTGEHPGNLLCECKRCGRTFSPWHDRPERWCGPCHRQRWLFDEDLVRTHAYELGEQSRERAQRELRERQARREREER
jgi:hypothetical protein